MNENLTPKKLFAVMLFDTELNEGISNSPEKWICTEVKYYNNGADALWAYANIPNPAITTH